MTSQEPVTPAPEPEPATVTDRVSHLDDLRSRIERAEYAVDPRAVARAILATLALRDSRS